MKGSSHKRLFLSVLAMVGLMMILGQISVFAQASGPSASPSQSLGSFLLNGGFYQLVDASGMGCNGQCQAGNWLAGSQCACPEGFIAQPIARILTDVPGAPNNQCGSTLFTCGRP
jgi:hypothetical protein